MTTGHASAPSRRLRTALPVTAAVLTLAACSSTLPKPQLTRLQRTTATQAHVFLTSRAYEDQVARSLVIAQPGIPPSAAEATAHVGVEANKQTPASAYRCTTVGGVNGVHQRFSCLAPLAGGGAITATATCNTKTTVCFAWRVATPS